MKTLFTIESKIEPGLSKVKRLNVCDLVVTAYETQAVAIQYLRDGDYHESYCVQSIPDEQFKAWVEYYVVTKKVTHIEIVDAVGQSRIVPISNHLDYLL